jgi:hypothetical protein
LTAVGCLRQGTVTPSGSFLPPAGCLMPLPPR